MASIADSLPWSGMLMRGRRIKLSIQLRMVIDLLYFARAAPTVPVPMMSCIIIIYRL
jgi:hypothetical protein